MVEYNVVGVEVRNEKGIHARPTMKLVDAVQKYGGDVRVLNLNNGREINVRDTPSMMTLLQAFQGCRLEIKAERVEGCDEMISRLANIVYNAA